MPASPVSSDPMPSTRAGLLAASAVFAASAIALYVRLYFGTDFSDESFYVALPYAFSLGHRPLQDELALHQLGGLMLLPAVQLYLAATKSPEGLVLFVRHLYFAYSLFCAALIVRYFTAIVGRGPALLLGAVSIAYVPFSIASLSYNTLASFGLRAGLVELAICLRSRRPLPDLFVGCFLLTTATVAYPPLAIACVPAVVWTLLLHARAQGAGHAARGWGVAALAALCALAPALGALAAYGDIEALRRLLEFDTAIEAQGGGRLKLARIAYELYVEGLFLAALGALVAAIAWVFRAATDRWRAAALLALTGPALFGVSWLYVNFNEPNSTTTFVISALGIGALFWVRGLGGIGGRRASAWALHAPGLRLVIVCSTLAGVCIAWASANGLRNAALGLLPAALVGLAFLHSRLGGRGGDLARGGRDLVFGVFVGSLLLFQIFDLYGNVYRDERIALLSERIEGGPFAGLWTTPRHRALAEGLERDIEALRRNSESVLFYDYFPAGYLMSDLRPRTPALWMFSSSRRWRGNQDIRRLYATSFEDPSEQPDLIVRMKIVPLLREQDMRVPPDDPVRRSFSPEHYETVAVRELYTIQRRRR